jgi:hypothetical protein
MSEEKKIPQEGQKNEGVSQNNEHPLPRASEKLSDELKIDASQSQSLTQHPTPNTQYNQEMEVHHQGHVHEKKKWKEYLFQFFMLFLAVFCGFLAEYQLEHTIEHQREKQFMKSMVEDLEKDTARLLKESEDAVVQYTKLDSLTEIIYNGVFSPYHIRKI